MPAAPHRLQWANALRGLAAVAVVIYHLGQAFWTRQQGSAALVLHQPLEGADAGSPPVLARFLHALPVDLGGVGIALFFVLSGFVIAISLDRYSRPGFFIGRFLRLIPTFAAAFLLCVMVVWAVHSSPGGAGQAPGVGGTVVGVIPGLPLLLGVDSTSLGVDWTLIIELGFYGVCLLAYRSLTRTWWAPLLVAAGCVLAQQAVGSQAVSDAAPQWLDGARYLTLLVTPFLPVLLIGVLVSSVHRGQLRPPALLVVPVLMAVNLWLMGTSTAVPTTGEYQFSVLLAVVIFLVLWCTAADWRPGPVLRYLSDISYPLYLTHAILGYALLAALTSRGWGAVPATAVAVVCALALATALHRLVELPTHHYGRLCAGRAGRRQPAEQPGPTAQACSRRAVLAGRR